MKRVWCRLIVINYQLLLQQINSHYNASLHDSLNAKLRYFYL